MRKTIPIAMLAAGVAIFTGASLAAPPPHALPSFDVTAADGSVTQTAQIARNGKWLLIFVKPNCPPCDSLLSVLDSDSTQDGSRVAVIVKAPSASSLAQLKLRYPRIAKSAWYADVHAKAASSLEVPASPTTLGMRGAQIAWRMTGSIAVLPTDESSGIAAGAAPEADPKMREHALVNGWLLHP